ncbi:hypothetical protein P148_SR1C00001G1024 [candidate division SR1 bacterium RAAC1_SR1_1]|nr:hypothetical protein P148_SR1C00001G1024 [candidate division SR1 bacterium RAAC1_SR1_1]
MIYSNQNYTLLRKPNGIASTFGGQQSILDYFEDSQQLQTILNNSDFDQYQSYCYLDGYTKQNADTFLHNQTTQFTKEQEYGLLNRLDNDTGGFLYFAKNIESYQFYKEQQHKGTIQKMYLAEVHGNPFFTSKEKILTIETPIMHHRSDDQKMIVVTDEKDKIQGRGEPHHVSTTIELISYNQERNTSLLHVLIHKGIRHQIRIHCKSIGAPIVGDKLYGPKTPISDTLHLRSIGMK